MENFFELTTKILNNKRLFFLSFATFAVGTEANAFVGVLEPLARDLTVSIAIAGQLSAGFALAYALSAPIVTAFAVRFDRKHVLIFALFALGILNISAGLAPSFEYLFGIRIICGLIATLVAPIAVATALRLVSDDQRGIAVSIVLSGLTLALVLGIPFGSIIGDWLSWRSSFFYAGGISGIAALLIFVGLPSVSDSDQGGPKPFSIIFKKSVILNLIYTFLSFTALFIMATYTGPVITKSTGVDGTGIGFIQSSIGIGSIFGLMMGGYLAQYAPDNLRILFIFSWIAITLSTYSLWMTGWLDLDKIWAIIVFCMNMFLGAVGFVALQPVIQVRLAHAVPVDTSVALAINGSMIYLGQSLGAVIGGGIVVSLGLDYVGIMGGGVALLGVIIALSMVFKGRE